ncbi:uncharacterized protein UMAG_01959 [Mycosarcoma maydis]|uniref:Uncharacterized protein n=1 Tax=Mycosarcoma maydis TaxID=5270 RepID=A0A0D1CWM9_MYCMD|nr:uncharacterized protein UMAG_01959 [Ustilago maydis 521]KIS70808.1 hypothetical protein UMAG_01959 [Ustilago maydis 521]|eukprot:XP_011387877.1 hypothetical protein UMAG_01959 [Ustilago maydis 521]
MKFPLLSPFKASSSYTSSSPPAPTFERARKYRPPPTSFHSSVQVIDEEFGTPRTSTQVKQAYLESHPNSAAESSSIHSETSSTHHTKQSVEFDSAAPTPSLIRSSISSPRRPVLSLCPSFQSPSAFTMPDEVRTSADHIRPSHGRGTAAEKGNALRAAADRDVGYTPHADNHKSSRRSSRRVSAHPSPRTSERDLDNDDHHAQRASRRSSKRYAALNEPAARRSSVPVSEKQSSGSAAAQGAAYRRGEHPTLPSAEETREARERHLRAAYGETPRLGKGSPNKPPVYPMTGIDNLALLMEDDSYTTSCFSIYMFRSVLDLETVDNFFEVLAETYPKYRYVVDLDPKLSKKLEKETLRAPPGTPSPRREFDAGRRTNYAKGLKAGSLFRPARWRYVPDFEIKDNIEHVAQCPDGGDDKALNKLAGQFLGRHFDYSKPIWEALVVNGLNTSDGGRSALMIKIHHCFSDGQGMIQSYHAALGALAQGIGIRDIQKKVDSNTSENKRPGQREDRPSMWGTIQHAGHLVRGLYFRKRKSFLYQTKRKRVADRLYCHSEGIDMNDIKMIRKAYGTPTFNLTLNDVALAILARALRIASERVDPSRRHKDKRVAIFVPISVRPKGDWSLSNATTGSIAWLRFEKEDKPNFEEQLAQVHREMGRVKRSYGPKILFKTFDIFAKRRITFLPNYPGLRQIYYRAFREYHVATNVPGPPKPVKFGEHEAYSYHVLPPSSPGKSTMAIGMISYANDFSLAVSCDDVPEFEHLAEEICTAFQDAAAQIIEAANEKLASNKQATLSKAQ